MFFFVYKKNFTTTDSGQALKAVVCQKCQTEYFYMMNRKTVGHGTALYGLGQGHAARHSAKVAQTKLQKKLDQEVDLVPCPKCHWVSQDMVEQYRRQIRGDQTLMMFTPLFAGGAIAAFSWVTTLGNRIHKEVNQHLQIAYYALGIGVALTVFIFGVRAVVRLRFNPNAKFPELPAAAAGSPEALLPQVDPETGKMILVTSNGRKIKLKNQSKSEQTSHQGII